jgi:hypothetical protein
MASTFNAVPASGGEVKGISCGKQVKSNLTLETVRIRSGAVYLLGSQNQPELRNHLAHALRTREFDDVRP